MDALDLLFVLDPLDTLVLETETSLLWIEACARRGHGCRIAHGRDLSLAGREPRVRARTVALDLEATPFYRLGPVEERAVASFDLVLMRKDPPVDAAYHDLLAVLALGRDRVPIVNDPVGLARSNEKLLPLEVPGAGIPTLVTADAETALAFAREHGQVVVKPMGEFSGHGIVRFDGDDPGLEAALEELLTPRRHVLVQRFLPAVLQGDKRVFVVDGEPIGWANRIPKPGSFHANIHQGARVEATELTDGERDVIAAAAPLLAARGLELAGFDFIGGMLTEINVTSPSAMRQIDRVMGIRLEERVVDWLERRAAEGVRRPLPGDGV